MNEFISKYSLYKDVSWHIPNHISNTYHNKLNVEITDTEVRITRENDNFKSYHGTANANIRNMIVGVTEGYEKKLECVGVGYRFQLKGTDLVVSAGHSHTWTPEIPAGISIEVPSNTELLVKGIDYADEQVQRKEGKKASK